MKGWNKKGEEEFVRVNGKNVVLKKDKEVGIRSTFVRGR
jgi:hypothetical protein